MACLCQMSFTPPYVLYSALHAPHEGLVRPHAEGYQRLLKALREDAFDFEAALKHEVLNFENLPIMGGQTHG